MNLPEDLTGVPTSQLVDVAFKLRTTINNYEAECKARIAPTEDQFNRVKAEIIMRFNREDISSLKVGSGSVSKVVKTKYTIAEPESFYKYVHDNGSFQLFSKSVIKGEVDSILESTGKLPDGIAPMSEISLRFNEAKGA